MLSIGKYLMATNLESNYNSKVSFLSMISLLHAMEFHD